MRFRAYLTELELELPLPRMAKAWLGMSVFTAGMYLLRSTTETIAPEDHVALSLLLCAFLTLAWMNLEQTVMTFSLQENRCWLRCHRHGTSKERSLPVTQIHSAKVEQQRVGSNTDTQLARIVLITSLGMIPVGEHFQENPSHLEKACQQINSFLQSQQKYLTA